MTNQQPVDPTPFTIDEIYLALKLRDLTGHDDWGVSRSHDEEQSKRYIRLYRIRPSGSYVEFERLSSIYNKKWFCRGYYPSSMELPAWF